MGSLPDDLASWLQGQPNWHDRLVFAGALARAVQTAQERGQVFGGLAPATVQVGADLGCELRPDAKTARRDGPQAAPELRDGRAPDARADVYSAGSLLYEVLSLKKPGPGAPRLGELVPDLPGDLADAVMACLEPDPEWRPKDLSYLAPMMAQAAPRPLPAAAAPAPAAARPASQKTGAVRAAAPAAAKPAPAEGAAPKPPRAPSPPGVTAAAGLLVLAAVGAVGWVARQMDQDSTAVVATTTTTLAAQAPATTATPPPVAPKPKATPVAAASTAPAAAPAPAAATPSPKVAAATPPPATTVPVPAPTSPPTPASAPVTAVAAPTPPPAPALPPVLTAVAPPFLRRPSNTLVDVRGQNLSATQQARVTRQAGGAAAGVEVVRQRLVNPGLLQVLIKVDANAAFGPYLLTVADPAGSASNALPFQINNSAR